MNRTNKNDCLCGTYVLVNAINKIVCWKAVSDVCYGEKNRQERQVGCRQQGTVLNGVSRASLILVDLKGVREQGMQKCRGRAFHAVGTASANVLG